MWLKASWKTSKAFFLTTAYFPRLRLPSTKNSPPPKEYKARQQVCVSTLAGGLNSFVLFRVLFTIENPGTFVLADEFVARLNS